MRAIGNRQWHKLHDARGGMVMALLNRQQGQTLVKLARATIAKRLGLQPGEAVEIDDPIFDERRATFVTLKKNRQLRGCIGNLVPVSSLKKGVCDNAINSAFNDYRFSPLQADEFTDIDIDVSVLTLPAPLAYTDCDDLKKKLRPHIDGVIIRDGARSATFLPQVWEQLPDVEQFLAHLCHKAGMQPEAWRQGRLEVEVYQTQSFGENE